MDIGSSGGGSRVPATFLQTLDLVSNHPEGEISKMKRTIVRKIFWAIVLFPVWCFYPDVAIDCLERMTKQKT